MIQVRFDLVANTEATVIDGVKAWLRGTDWNPGVESGTLETSRLDWLTCNPYSSAVSCNLLAWRAGVEYAWKCNCGRGSGLQTWTHSLRLSTTGV